MPITFPDEACAITITRKSLIIASDNSKTKTEWQAYAITLLSF